MKEETQSTTRSSEIAAPRGRAIAALGYVILVVYGSLYPFSGWVVRRDPFAFLLQGWSGTQVSLGDVGT
ncbi:MAG TPA: hypothetical protein VEF92_03690, partial [Burkholderiales bacterium]|nr:hypothetical protein [Burkholderiales bacterium]